MITVKINSVDVSDQISWPSLQVQQLLTNEVDTASFTYEKYGSRSYVPAINDEIEVFEDSNKIFGGNIINIEEDNLSNPDGISYLIQASDYSAFFNNVLVSKAYQTVAAAYAYRKKVTVTGITGAGAGCEVLISTGESSGATCDVDVNGNAASFPSAADISGDLRFQDASGNDLQFYIESVSGVTPNRVAKIWVKVNADLGSNQDIYLYYNGPTTNVSSNAGMLGYKLAAYYRLNEASGTVAKDLLGNYNGTNSNATVNQAGEVGTAYSFNGSNAQISVPHIDIWNGDFTITAKVKRNSSGVGDYIFGKENVYTNDQALHIGFRNTDHITFAFYADDLDTAATYTDTVNWYDLGFAYTHSTRLKEIYINKALTDSAIGVGDPNFGTVNETIGNALGGNWFGGKIDEVGVYKAKLSATEMANKPNTYFNGDDLTIGPEETVSGTTWTLADIVNDLISNYAPDFTTTNVIGTTTIAKVVFNEIYLNAALKKLADITKYDWYVDVNKDLHFFPKETNAAPFGLTDTSGNYINESLSRVIDGSQVVNRVIVKGGYGEGAAITNSITVNGNTTTDFTLPYQLSDLTATLDTGSGPVALTIGIDQQDDPASFDCLYNYNNSVLRFPSALSDGDIITYIGKPQVPIKSIISNSGSIALYGLKEKLITDNTIVDITVARTRAKAELLAYQYGSDKITFNTYTSGLRQGMLLTLSSAKRGISEKYIINSVSLTARTPNDFAYTVSAITTNQQRLVDLLQKINQKEDNINDTSIAESITTDLTDVTISEIIRRVSPKLDDAIIDLTENIYKDPLGAGVEPIWVLGPYTPSSVSDTKRQGRLEISLKLY